MLCECGSPAAGLGTIGTVLEMMRTRTGGGCKQEEVLLGELSSDVVTSRFEGWSREAGWQAGGAKT